jgi:hypothetical protein
MAKVLRVSSGGVPANSYLALFLGVEDTHNDEYGAGLRWEFEVVSGPHKGAKTSRTTSQTPTLKNACGKMLAGITAKTLVPDEDIDLDAYIGKTFFIVVVNTEKGGTRIDSVSPPPVG